MRGLEFADSQRKGAMTASEAGDRAGGERISPAVACGLGGKGLDVQAGRWRRLVGEAGLGAVETDEGVRVRFRGEPSVERELRALIAVERECCRWARWGIRRDGRALVLDVRSNEEGAAILHRLFAYEPTDGGSRSGGEAGRSSLAG
jgi:hypothetical protein